MDPALARKLAQQREKAVTGRSAVADLEPAPHKAAAKDGLAGMDPMLARRLLEQRQKAAAKGDGGLLAEQVVSSPKGTNARKPSSELERHLLRQRTKVLTGESAVENVGSPKHRLSPVLGSPSRMDPLLARRLAQQQHKALLGDSPLKDVGSPAKRTAGLDPDDSPQPQTVQQLDFAGPTQEEKAAVVEVHIRKPPVEYPAEKAPVEGTVEGPIEKPPTEDPVAKAPAEDTVEGPIEKAPVEDPVVKASSEDTVQGPIEKPPMEDPVAIASAEDTVEGPLEKAPTEDSVVKAPAEDTVEGPLEKAPMEYPVAKAPAEDTVEGPIEKQLIEDLVAKSSTEDMKPARHKDAAPAATEEEDVDEQPLAEDLGLGCGTHVRAPAFSTCAGVLAERLDEQRQERSEAEAEAACREAEKADAQSAKRKGAGSAEGRQPKEKVRAAPRGLQRLGATCGRFCGGR